MPCKAAPAVVAEEFVRVGREMHLEVLELLETFGAHAACILLASVWPLHDLSSTLVA